MHTHTHSSHILTSILYTPHTLSHIHIIYTASTHPISTPQTHTPLHTHIPHPYHIHCNHPITHNSHIPHTHTLISDPYQVYHRHTHTHTHTHTPLTYIYIGHINVSHMTHKSYIHKNAYAHAKYVYIGTHTTHMDTHIVCHKAPWEFQT